MNYQTNNIGRETGVSFGCRPPEPVSTVHAAIPTPKPAKPFHVPSPPRLSDLRRKYGVAISAAGHSPIYSSTPSPSPSPGPGPSPTPARTRPLPAAKEPATAFPLMQSAVPASKEAALKEVKEARPSQAPARPAAKEPLQKYIPLGLDAEEDNEAPEKPIPLVIAAPTLVKATPAAPQPIVKLPAQVQSFDQKNASSQRSSLFRHLFSFTFAYIVYTIAKNLK